MKVVITGAGIGGLTTALWLHHLGIDRQVYEQGKSIGELGVGINVLICLLGERPSPCLPGCHGTDR